ncbi:MAG: tRNA (adenosine(37)-N6)-threonylcarbamoyltransferase complex dimerization subunit type 1 TsaB [Thermodesulfobacteriota bacterium]
MKILAVDTATKTCSVAVSDDSDIIVAHTARYARTHARHIMTMIDGIVQAAEITMEDIDGFAVTLGPGSFTGLRIGISTVKGLAMAVKKPVAGVSALEALAAQFFAATDLICPLIDARKGEVYAGVYRWTPDGCEPVFPAKVASPEQAVSGIDGPCLFVGNGAAQYRQRISACLGEWARFVPPVFNPVRAAMVAHLGYRQFAAHSAGDARTVQPVYIRRPDAQRPPRQKA